MVLTIQTHTHLLEADFLKLRIWRPKKFFCRYVWTGVGSYFSDEDDVEFESRSESSIFTCLMDVAKGYYIMFKSIILY
jgi:hypothetical protein